MFPNFNEFKVSVESFAAAAYVKRLKQSFILHDIKEGKQVSAVILCYFMHGFETL